MVTLDPRIPLLDPNSLTYSVYTQLYTSFFNAQDKKSESNPFGVVEGDETSIRLKNTAFNFASAIAGVVTDASTGSSALKFLEKAGGSMVGLLQANNGFEAGIENHPILTVSSDGVNVTGKLSIGGNNFYLDGHQILRYDKDIDRVFLTAKDTKILGNLVFGDNDITVNKDGIRVKGKEVYHTGNANISTVNWQMKDGNVSGNLSVSGKSVLGGELSALNGVKIGYGNQIILSFSNEQATLNGHLNILDGFGIKLSDTSVLYGQGQDVFITSGDQGQLYLGSKKSSIRLLGDIKTADDQYTVISKYGKGYLPDGLTVRHNFGKDILQTYRKNNDDQGVIIPEKLRFSNSSGYYLYSNKGENLELHSPKHNIGFSFLPSTSYYKPLNKESDVVSLNTSADMFRFMKNIEAKDSVGIDGSATKLIHNGLFFTNLQRIIAVSDGIQHYGDASFANNLGSLKFVSGFAGEGWAIQKRQVSGNIVATFDELTIRKKVRVYEFEVQKSTGTNGPLWISDSCSADSVIKL